MKLRFLILMLVAALLAGCGGSVSDAVGDVSGFVQDINGNPVRNARVFVDGGPETTSNSAGSYTLQSASGDIRTIKATTTQDGVSYYGETVVQIFDGEVSKSQNITVVPSSQRATLRGTVRDNHGDLVEGAHVFASAVDNGGHVTVFSSVMVLTDSNGRFEMPALFGGVSYSVIASARTFNSDTEIVNIPAGNSDDLDFTLRNSTDPLLMPPANLTGTAWTTPGEPTTRVRSQAAGLNAVKLMIDPKRRTRRTTRDTIGGNFIEIDLEWDPMSDPALLGFEIYRGNGDVPFNNLNALDFYRDPQAYLYEDAEVSFQENQTYSYAVTALNTNIPDTNNSESDFSNRVVVHTLGDMNIDAVTLTPVTFHWEPVVGATDYEVFVFDRYPSIGITSIWSGVTSGNALAYSGPPALTSGHTYYYVVMARANSNFSRSLSFIDSFVAP